MSIPLSTSDTSASETLAGLYEVNNYRFEDSIGYLLKRVRMSMSCSIDREMLAFDVSSEQWSILMRISQGKSHTAGSLARDAGSDTGSMTRMIDRLEFKGLLRRNRSAEDRRVVNLELTDNGRAVVEHLTEVVVKTLNRHLHGFSRDELETLKGFMRRMLENQAGERD